jgi:hypothetical protein
METQGIEFFGDSNSFMRRPAAITAAGADHDRAKRFFRFQQMDFHKRLKLILRAAGSGAFAIMP